MNEQTTDALDLTIPGDEIGRIVIIWTSEGWSMNITGQVDAMMMMGAGAILNTEGQAAHMQAKVQAMQAAQRTGLVAARAIPQDHQRRRRDQ